MDKLFEIEHLGCSYDKHFVPGVSKVILEIKRLVIPRGKKVFGKVELLVVDVNNDILDLQ